MEEEWRPLVQTPPLLQQEQYYSQYCPSSSAEGNSVFISKEVQKWSSAEVQHCCTAPAYPGSVTSSLHWPPVLGNSTLGRSATTHTKLVTTDAQEAAELLSFGMNIFMFLCSAVAQMCREKSIIEIALFSTAGGLKNTLG